MSRRLPPFGKQFTPIPGAGIRVAIGPTAWGFQKSHCHPIMVLPEQNDPTDFAWPSDGRPALIFECGTFDDVLLHSTAQALILAGASSVVAIRETLLDDYDARVYFDPEVRYVSE